MSAPARQIRVYADWAGLGGPRLMGQQIKSAVGRWRQVAMRHELPRTQHDIMATAFARV
jgi:hypothetical protein